MCGNDDVISTQIVGHMFAYPIVYDLVAEEEEEKKTVAGLLEEIICELADALSTQREGRVALHVHACSYK